MRKTPKGPKGPHLIDIHVGHRLRARRKQRGLSQVALSQKIGLTFQQMQKYEHGDNRISASKLWDLSRVLQVPIAYFYGGLDDAVGSASNEMTQRLFIRLMATDQGPDLAKAFQQIRSPATRRAVTDLVRSIVENERGDQD